MLMCWIIRFVQFVQLTTWPVEVVFPLCTYDPVITLIPLWPGPQNQCYGEVPVECSPVVVYLTMYCYYRIHGILWTLVRCVFLFFSFSSIKHFCRTSWNLCVKFSLHKITTSSSKESRYFNFKLFQVFQLKTGLEVVKNDMKSLVLASPETLDLHAWRRKFGGIRAQVQFCLELSWDSFQDEWP